MVYKGKWHLSKPADGASWVPSDVNQYGFTRWNPPDAGANQDIARGRRRHPDNDGRFMNDDGDAEAGDEGVLAYLRSVAAQQQPFFLVVSLVNPHDVLFYPKTYIDGGYDDTWLEGEIELPATVDEDLSTKPTVQRAVPAPVQRVRAAARRAQKKRNYLNFYGNLMKASDAYLVQVLDTLETQTGCSRTRWSSATADHGEMGMAHGGHAAEELQRLRGDAAGAAGLLQPAALPAGRGRATRSSPTSTSCRRWRASFDAPDAARADWQGVDYSDAILDPLGEGRRRTTSSSPTTTCRPASRAARTCRRRTTSSASARRRYKLAQYYDADGNDARPVGDVRPGRPTRSSGPTSPGRATRARPDQERAVPPPEAQARATVQRTRLRPLD